MKQAIFNHEQQERLLYLLRKALEQHESLSIGYMIQRINDLERRLSALEAKLATDAGKLNSRLDGAVAQFRDLRKSVRAIEESLGAKK